MSLYQTKAMSDVLAAHKEYCKGLTQSIWFISDDPRTVFAHLAKPYLSFCLQDRTLDVAIEVWSRHCGYVRTRAYNTAHERCTACRSLRHNETRWQ